MLDSLGKMSTPPLIGAYDRLLDSSDVITTEQRHWIDHRYLGDLLQQHPGVFVVHQGSEGQYDQLSVRGQDWRSIAVTSNGRLLNDPASGIYNLYYTANEYADRIEFVSGPRAFLYGLNSTGGAVNLVTKNYNSNRPLSRLNYTESGYNYSYTDGTFSQNISRRLNVTLGFQQQSTEGRFQNSAHEAWNVRGKLRYNLTRDINIILSEYFTQTTTQLNGGVNPALSPGTYAFDPILATMVNMESYEKVRRHDLDLSLVGTFFGDSVNLSALTLYYSNSKREYRDEEDRTTQNGIFIQSDHISSWMGAMLTQNIDTDFQRLSIGSNVEVRQIEGSPNMGRRRNVIGSVWGKEELLFGDMLTVAGFVRFDHYLKDSYTGYGADGRLRLLDEFALHGGFSVSRRVPTYQELHWTDFTVTRIAPLSAETHRQIELGGTLTVSGLSLRISYFHRTVADPIRILSTDGVESVFPTLQFVNGGDIVTNGIEASLNLRIWVLTVEGSGMFLEQRAGERVEYYPRLSARGGLYYQNRLFEDKLDLKAGFQGHYASAHDGLRFNPEVLAYVPNTGSRLGYGSTVDFVLMAHIGDAYIHLIWENLASSQYFLAPFFPVQDRQVRFGISWQFLD